MAGLGLGVALPVAHEVIPHRSLHSAVAGADASVDPTAHHRAGTNGPGAVEAERGVGQDNCPRHTPPFIDDDFPQPEFRHSENGSLATTLRADTGPTRIDGAERVSSTYEGMFPGPTLVFCPGDTVSVDLENSLDPGAFSGHHAGVTNLHTHGLHVSPREPQDNVFVEVAPGESYPYRYDVPADHRPGAYWYHPHFHGQTSPQTRAGMAGAIIVEGGLDEVPAYREIGQRLLVIQKTSIGGPEPQFLVNGSLNPEIPIRPGEIQRWSVVNATNGFVVDAELEGQPLHLLARDGNYVPRRRSRDSLVIPPGSRREVLVVGSAEGSAELIAKPFVQFPGDTPPAETLATLVSAGPEADDTMPPKRVHKYPDLRKAKVDRRHRIVYTQDLTQDPVEFYINGRPFEERGVDEVMRLGDVEQWKILNPTEEWHSFHIHIQDFQLIEIDGDPVRGVNQMDNVGIPPGGSVTMRTRPTEYTGKFVFHCHVLGHEDLGMMATVRVKR